MCDFHEAHPEYSATGWLDELRAVEYKYLSLVGMPSGGAVRVSLGVASTLDDVEKFLNFAETTYRDRHPNRTALTPRTSR